MAPKGTENVVLFRAKRDVRIQRMDVYHRRGTERPRRLNISAKANTGFIGYSSCWKSLRMEALLSRERDDHLRIWSGIL